MHRSHSIVIVNPLLAYERGGAEVNDLNLGKALRQLGHKVTHIAVRDRRRPELAIGDEVPAAFVEMRYFFDTATRLPWLFGKIARSLFFWCFVRALTRQRPAALDDAELVLLTGKPILTRIKRNVVARVVQSVRGFTNPLNLHYLFEADGVIFWGGCEADHRDARLERIRRVALNPSVEETIFHPGPPDPAVRATLQGGRSDAIVVTYTGRLDPIQQVDQIIGAVAQLLAEGYDLRLAILGDGNIRAELEAFANERLPAGAFVFLGHRPRSELGDFLRASDIFVMNPRWTSYSLSLKEAVACGVFAIAPDTGRVARSLLDDDGASIFPANDAQALTAALRDALADRRYDTSRRRSRGDGAALHSWQSVAEALVAWYDSELVET